MGVQVKLATKDGKGNPLPINKRQFISFSYDGKDIEDFDLMVVFSNGRLDKEIYFPFNDVTSKNEALDGQQYWGSTFDAGRLSFNLATDGMTSQNYEAFKNHFIPGKIANLILSEFPNRAIKARIASAPKISLLPFESKQEVKIGNSTKIFSTSLYKGDVVLDFVMDDPYWFALKDYINDKTDSEYLEEDIKIIYEDGIPALSMFDNEENSDKYFILGGNYVVNLKTDEKLVLNKTSIQNPTNIFLYNCGTVATKPIIKFTITPIFNENNKIVFLNDEEPYFKIGKNSLKFTTPSIITSYNQTVKILNNYGSEGNSILELRNQFRDNLHNYYTRSYMIALLDSLRANENYVKNGSIQKNFLDTFLEEMKNFIGEEKENDGDTEFFLFPIACTFDSQKGEAQIETKCNIFGQDGSIDIAENAGDILKSNYLKIEDRTLPNEGIIKFENCLPVNTNCNLSDINIDFKYTYL